MTQDYQFMLSKEEQGRLDTLAQREPDNIKHIASELKGEARVRYLLALQQRKQ